MSASEEPGTGGQARPPERTPLREEHLALDARMAVTEGFEMPMEYSGVTEEVAAVRNHAGIFDVSHLSEFRVFGFEAFEALQFILAGDLREIGGLGASMYTLMCGPDGGIVDDIVVYHSGDIEYLLVGNALNRRSDGAWLAQYLPDSVEFADESDRTGMISLQGPDAVGIVKELSGQDPPERFDLGEARLDGRIPVLLSRTGYTGEDGVEIVCHESHAVAIWRLLLSFPEITPCGMGARDTLRLEMGYVLYGRDIDRTKDPLSARLGSAVALDKGDFIGHDALAEIGEKGPALSRVGLDVQEGLPEHGSAVLHAGAPVGTVSSGTFSPTLRHGIAMAYVPTAIAAEGTAMKVAIQGREVDARIARMPFVTGTSLSPKSRSASSPAPQDAL